MIRWIATLLIASSLAAGDTTPAVSDVQISRSGALAFVRLDGPVTAVGAMPTISVDGASVAINPRPFWGATSHRFPWVAYQIQTPIKPGQVVTYSAPAGFAATSGGPAPAIPAGSPVNNYAGRLEPQFTAAPTMKVGANHSPSPNTLYSVCPIGQDLSARFAPPTGTSLASWPTTAGINSWISSQASSKLGVAAGPTVVFADRGGTGTGAIATCTISGGAIQSVQIATPGSGYAAPMAAIVGGGGGGSARVTCTQAGGAIASVAVTSGGAGYCDGIYTVQWDDARPVNGLPTTQLSLYDGTQGGSNLLFTSVGSNAGLTVKGIQYGCSRSYYVQYRPEAAYKYGAAIGMWFKGGWWNGASYTNTAINWTATGPGNVPDRRNPVAPDGAALDWCTFTMGVGASTIRYMDCTLPGGAVSNAADSADVSTLADLSQGNPAIRRVAKVIAARPYLRSVSPTIAVNGPSPGSTTTAPYTIPAKADGVPNWTGDPAYASVEYVTEKPHGFSTYQTFWSNPAAGNSLAIVNAAGATSSVVVPGYPGPVWVTGPNTFATVYDGPKGGPWNAAAAQPGLPLPFYAWVTLRDGGCIPYDTAAGFSAAVPGSGCWVNVPICATDDLVTSIVQSVARWLPPGRKIWIEYTNEPWNAGFPSYNAFGQIGSLVGLGPTEFYTARAARVHDVAASVLEGMGRGGDLVRVFGSFLAVPQTTAKMVNYANAHQIKIDAIAIAPYWIIPDDPPFVTAFASVASTNPKSIATGTAWPWTRAMAHEVLRNAILYDANYVGPTGWVTGHQKLMASYKNGPPPALVGYEGSLQQFVPNGTGMNTVNLERDLFYDPGMYDTVNAYFLMCQAGGMQELLYFQLANDFNGAASWNLATNSGQTYGRGDGSDGRAKNLFWMEANAIPGGVGTIPAYTATWDRYNCSPGLQAWRDWGMKANAPLPTRGPR